MNSKKWQWSSIIITVCFLAAISLPYLLASRAAGNESDFGGFLLNPLDGNSYLAKMMEGWRGEWLFTLPYTAKTGEGKFLYGFYLFLGHLSRWSGLPPVTTFHLSRLLSAMILLVILMRFFKAVLPDRRLAGLAFALAALGSGMGWLALSVGAITADFWVAESYPFLSAYANPHFPLGLALVLWLLTPAGTTRMPRQDDPVGKRRFTWITGHRLAQPAAIALVSLALAAISPFGVVVVLCILSTLFLIELWGQLLALRKADSQQGQGWRLGAVAEVFPGWARSLRLADPTVLRLPWILLGGAPLVVYEVWATWSDPILAGWNAQNLTPSPPPWDLVIALSPALLLALPGAWAAVKTGTPGSRILLAWVGISLLLLYFPFTLQRRFMLGLYVPLAALAALGVGLLAAGCPGGAMRAGRFRFLAVLLLLLALPTNLVILLAARQGIRTQDSSLYMSKGEVQAFDWLAGNTPVDAIVLGAPGSGLLIPAHTGRRVIYGHPFETVNAAVEKAWVERYFETGDLDLAGLHERGVDFIFAGPREHRLNPALSFPGLTLSYQAEGVSIYAVPPPGQQP